MSETRQPDSISGRPPPQPLYPYPPEGVKLPPMSSLLMHHATIEHHPNPHPSQSFQSHTQHHPIHFSENNPSAPVTHVYHPPPMPDTSTGPRYQTNPVLVPAQPQHISLEPIQYEGPLAQRRQSKKISQRRTDLPKRQFQVNRSSVPLEGRFSDQDPPPPPRKYSDTSPQECQNTGRRAVPIAGLLSEPTALQRSTAIYTLTIRQQPQSARACGYGERDRRVVDPPPILVLDVENPTGRPETYVVICILWNAETDTDASSMPESTERKQQRRLMGTNVSSPFPGKDEHNVPRTFFTFPDISVRTPGMYRLKFSLCVMDLMTQGPGSQNPVATFVMSDPFQVFNAKDFGGMQASSALTRSLKAQGCLIPVKKGNSKTNPSHLRDEEDDEDGDDDMDDGDDDMTKPPKPEKRMKR